MKTTKKAVKALVESDVGAKLAWARRVARKRFCGLMVTVWKARTTDGREWWVIPYPEPTVFPAEAWPDHHSMWNSYVDFVFCLWDVEIAERFAELPSVGTCPAESLCR